MAIDLKRICEQHHVTPRGVIHIGAHEGEELKEYRKLGVQRVLFIEANPAVYEKLAARVGNIPGVGVVRCAIADHDGVATLRVTSGSQSSSLLPLKLHREIYPEIVETQQIQVDCRRLDTLMSQLQMTPAEFNVMHLDIQGAELMALKGARRQMIFTDVIRSEVNLAELYAGCPLIGEMDSFMASSGYTRVLLELEYHPTWGDAIYLGRPVVTMQTLGTNGRFANQLFQYMFLRIYAKLHGLEYQVPGDWRGPAIFGFNDPPITCDLPQAIETEGELRPFLVDALASGIWPLKRVDLVGHFQYHTKRYRPHRDFIRELFRPLPAIQQPCDAALQKLRERGRTIVAIHLRRGDYLQPMGFRYQYVAPSEWYLKWLEPLWPTLDQPVLYLASDDLAMVSADFGKYSPVTANDVGVTIPEAPEYLDYHILRHADVVAISNSTFSFHACMLNDVAKTFVRPNPMLSAMMPFDPWDDRPLLRPPREEAAT